MVPLKQITEAQTSQQLNLSQMKQSLCSVPSKASAPAVTFLTAYLIPWVWMHIVFYPLFYLNLMFFFLSLFHTDLSFSIFFLCIVFFLVYNYLVSTNSDSKLEIKFIPNLCPVYFLLHTPSLPDNIYFLSFGEGVFMTVV